MMCTRAINAGGGERRARAGRDRRYVEGDATARWSESRSLGDA